MPELPEVETVRRGLSSRILGRSIREIRILNEKSFRAPISDIKAFAENAEITSVGRRGKMLIIGLSSNYSLLIHLRMTGQLIFREADDFIKNDFGGGHPNESMIGKLPDNTTRIVFVFDDESQLFFNDQRKFGFVKLVANELVNEESFLKKLGPEIVDFTADNISEKPSEDTFLEFIARARHHQKSSVKSVILNQSVVAGIGNIYADEALWGAKIHPSTKICELSDNELREILCAAKNVMEKSLTSGGSTMKNYLRTDGTKGSYLDKFANVFRRENLPCPRCKTEIIKLKVAGRGTHICPNCQKIHGEGN